MGGREELEEREVEGGWVPDGELPDVAGCIGMSARGGGGGIYDLLNKAQWRVRGWRGVNADSRSVWRRWRIGKRGLKEAVVAAAEEGIDCVGHGGNAQKHN